MGGTVGEAAALRLMTSTTRLLPPLRQVMQRIADTVEVVWPSPFAGPAALLRPAPRGGEFTHSEKSIRRAFRHYGRIKRVQLARAGSEANRLPSRATVQYETEESAARAARANPRPLASRRCDCAATNDGWCLCPRFEVRLRLPRPAAAELQPLEAIRMAAGVVHSVNDDGTDGVDDFGPGTSLHPGAVGHP